MFKNHPTLAQHRLTSEFLGDGIIFIYIISPDKTK